MPIKLRQFEVNNFKSLQNVSFEPGDLTFVIGPNAGGKSNLLTSLEFFGDVLSFGLEAAMTKHGGPQGIWRRGSRGAIGEPISLGALIDVDIAGWPIHSISYHLELSQGIEGHFGPVFVSKEWITLTNDHSGIRLDRVDNKVVAKASSDAEPPKDSSRRRKQDPFAPFIYYHHLTSTQHQLPPHVTIWQSLIFPMLSPLKNPDGMFRRFSLFPVIARQGGVPAHAATLGSAGENLPAVVRWLERNHQKGFDQLQTAIKRLVPSIKGLKVEETLDRRWFLRFTDDTGIWSANDVSDGTLMSLALAVTMHDPRFSFIMVEELENCLHPWILREVIKHIRTDVAKQDGKQMIVTTHSPIIIAQAQANEVWVVFRRQGGSIVRRLTEIDQADWDELNLGDYVDQGGIVEWLPPSQGGVM